MKKYGVNELRKMFLEFFESKGHLALKSFSLIPQNDKSLLLINSGMAPLKPYFTGAEIPPRTRVTTCQKCIRTGDIENVGKTARHGTFFEMLGNFSFGDYFKREAIHWSWEFLTEVVGLDADRLYPSVYLEDDEAFKIWNEEIGIAPERIFKFGKEDNFWEHGSGPCGPCSEIYYDRGVKYGCGKPGCTVGCECDRYIEVWNNVFTQFDNDGEGHYTELVQKNIDTGMGLERLAVVVQDVDSIFDVDTIQALRNKVCEIAGKEYHKDHETDVSIRLITDHIRSATFMISDGIMPTNEGRGYVLRRLIRRAVRHGRVLGLNVDNLLEIASIYIDDIYAESYPLLKKNKEFVITELKKEINRFESTVENGMKEFRKILDQKKKAGSAEIDGKSAFYLYDTFGFPIELTVEMAGEEGLTVDEDGFAKAMEEQKQKARDNQNFSAKLSTDNAALYESLDASVVSEFVGYDTLTAESGIAAMNNGSEWKDVLCEGEEGTIITLKTPFYATMGGQKGDFGVIRTGNGTFEVQDTVKLPGGRIGHIGKVVSGTVAKGETASLSVSALNRGNTCKNHTATHLLQEALREVLGDHVEQSGSYQDGERTRFDFSHGQAMTAEEIKKVEEIVNEKIAEDLPVETKIMSLEEARKTGAMALFGEKYGDTVRVVMVGDFSKELCGGTHVGHTGEIASFKILSESGVAAGIRRIEAITGRNVTAYYQDMEEKMNAVAKVLKTTPASLLERSEHLMAEMKALQSENESLKSKAAKDALGDVSNQVSEVKGVKLLATSVSGVDMNGLRDLGDQLKTKIGEGVIVLISDCDGKVNMVAMATEEAIAKGAHAGNLIKGIAALVGGGGGGRPGMAQAGGKNPAGIGAAVAETTKVLEDQLK